ncbi:16S rRNA (guanine(527)-N(7))-methyltransferase RsmG [Trichlorobacter ammonificans]|uniref:Ribosomal RNA small subunit methyltransferase G n=1 Tax=Trichlorobacter ammonificans TaxID=2916410 RepID=A0ABN8HM36_9BACT|nr:16S rRNA (guanine(527)-N(7))-methyltransferase RsmG [Trichlorobacter ammonificans]CAH2032710.1 Ribosomal RNA small subunit methyltransferase G [Trichlorobacter ammonificans]
MSRELLLEGAKGFGLELSERMLEQLTLFQVELKRWNRAFNLTALKNDEQIVIKHFIDSFSVVPLLGQEELVLDVGSGAGLPGIVAAILRGDLAITSLDAVDKKVRFQRHICRLLGLERVTAVHERVETHLEQNSGRYHVVTSRAFRDPLRFVQVAHQLIRPGGRLIAMVAGDGREYSAVVSVIEEQFALRHRATRHYRLPRGMGERSLVVFEQT